MLFELKDTVITSPELHYPKLNEWSVFSEVITRPSDYEDLDTWIKDTPEAISIINAIRTDLIGEGIYFEPIDDLTKGVAKEKLKTVREFYEQTFFKEEFGKAILDWLIYGDCYLWKGKIKGKQLEPIYNKAITVAKKLGLESKDIPEIKQIVDEDFTLKTIKHMPANTMNIDHDRYRIKQFRQVVLGQSTVFKVEEVIHAKLMTLRGKVYGYSPMIGALPEIQCIGYIKNYAKNYFKFGGTPDWMFILKQEQTGSVNYNAFVQQLQKYSHPVTSRGHMVLTGEVEREQLNQMNKDMEFRLLAIYLTGVLAMAFNMPVTRIMQIVGGEIRQRGTGADIANDAYWRSISEKQDFWEILLNTQLWRPYFKVNMRFKRGYRQDEVRESEIRTMNWSVANQMMVKDFPVNDEYIFRMLNIDEKYRTGKPIPRGMPKEMEFGKPPRPSKEIQKGQEAQAESTEKRKESRPQKIQDRIK